VPLDAADTSEAAIWSCWLSAQFEVST